MQYSLTSVECLLFLGLLTGPWMFPLMGVVNKLVDSSPPEGETGSGGGTVNSSSPPPEVGSASEEGEMDTDSGTGMVRSSSPPPEVGSPPEEWEIDSGRGSSLPPGVGLPPEEGEMAVPPSPGGVRPVGERDMVPE